MRKFIVVFIILDLIAIVAGGISIFNKYNIRDIQGDKYYPTELTYFISSEKFQFKLDNNFFTIKDHANEAKLNLKGFSVESMNNIFDGWIKSSNDFILPPEDCKFVGINLFFSDGQVYESLNSENNFTKLDSKSLAFAKHYKLLDNIFCSSKEILKGESHFFIE